VEKRPIKFHVGPNDEHRVHNCIYSEVSRNMYLAGKHRCSVNKVKMYVAAILELFCVSF